VTTGDIETLIKLLNRGLLDAVLLTNEERTSIRAAVYDATSELQKIAPTYEPDWEAR
jgi:hypothetical protein